jgi:hypothetical protein
VSEVDVDVIDVPFRARMASFDLDAGLERLRDVRDDEVVTGGDPP